MVNMHPTALVSPKAKIGKDVTIGPFAVVEDDVEIGSGTKIGPHAVIYNGSRIGKNVKIFQSASVGNLPQDLKFAGEDSILYVGDNTIIREFVTLHRGTIETGFTKIGTDCLLMAYAHVAHDCIVGNNCIIANSVQLGGHVILEDWVIIGGTSAVHQFCKIGKHSMIGGGYRVVNDVPPFILAAHEPLRYNGLNTVGLRRRGFSNDTIYKLKSAYSLIYDPKLNYSQAIEELTKRYPDDPEIKSIIDFISNSKRGIIKG